MYNTEFLVPELSGTRAGRLVPLSWVSDALSSPNLRKAFLSYQLPNMSEVVRPAFDGRDRPQLSYGIDFSTAAARHVTHTFKASRVYVICSGSLSRNTDALKLLLAALGPENVAGQRIGMKPNTQWSEVLEIVADARKVQADLLLTLGAGSLTDGAKIVSFALANDVHTSEDLKGLAEGPEKRTGVVPSTVPIISVPTSLSGGEYSDYAGGTEDETSVKYLFYPPLRGPELIILDPQLVETTPDSIWLSTGIRAVDHCVEVLCSIGIPTPESDGLARNALGRLVSGLLRCKKDRADRDGSLQCQLGSVDAMAACSSIPFKLGASHGIGHQVCRISAASLVY